MVCWNIQMKKVRRNFSLKLKEILRIFDVKNCLLQTISKCWIGQRLVERLYMLSPRIEGIGGGRIYSSRASVVGRVELVVLTTNLGNQEDQQN